MNRRSNFKFRARWLGVLLATVAFGRSQTVTPETTKFEVASIKPTVGTDGGCGVGVQPGGRLNAHCVSLKFLIRFAYNVQDFQISGGPSWTDSDIYDIAAKADSNASLDQMRPVLQSLLEDRFKLALRRETRELPVYKLVEAKGGTKITASAPGGCVVPDRNNPPRPGEHPHYCGSISLGRGFIEGYSVPMQRLLAKLSNAVNRIVIDKTGLTGTFDVHLEYAADEVTDPGGSTAGQPVPSAESNSPSIFTALQEQLGLKFENAKGPVEVLVIDHVERPSEN